VHIEKQTKREEIEIVPITRPFLPMMDKRGKSVALNGGKKNGPLGEDVN